MTDSANDDDELRRNLTHEIMQSERLRVMRLAGMLSVILVMILILLIVAPRFVDAIFHGALPYRVPLYTFLPFIAYELISARFIVAADRRGSALPAVRRYGNALVETSFPSLLIWLLSGALPGPLAFSTWPSLLYFLFIILSTLRLDFWLSAFTGAVAAVELFVLASLRLPLAWVPDDRNFAITHHLTRSLVLLASGFIAGSVAVTIRRQFERAIEASSARDRVTNLFGQHVSQQVVDRLLAIGKAELTETLRVCIMFVDIRSFTAAARARQPAEVVERLNDFFAILVEIVERHGGIINKFLGDGALAIFGAPLPDPDAAANAIQAGREILAAVGRANEDSKWPIRIGLGLHIGEAVAGNVGSLRRKEYTVIGDTVNLASRLEALNKELSAQFLISDAVREASGGTAAGATSLGPIEVRGYTEPVTVWRLA